jgi:RNA polymerase sigma factor (sigma-70 family)
VNHSSDQQLLREYTERRVESAFTELVRRHIDFVYSAARRMVHDAHLAEDVTQAVFVTLAKNARQLMGCRALEGWLHGTTRNLAGKAVRTEVRRRTHEQEAAIMNEILSTGAGASWEHVAPYLDDALGELSEPERDALLLRYFKNQDFRTVGATLGISDDAAQKRVSRAVEQLREFFAKRGVAVGAGGLVILISANAVQAAPVGLAVTISTAVATATITTATIATHTTMHWLNIKTIAAVVAAALTAGTATHFVEQRNANRLQDDNQRLVAERDKLIAERNATLASAASDKDELASGQNNHMELLRLRGQVGVLREQVKEMAKLREENRQLQARLAIAAHTSEQAETKSEADQQRAVAIAKMNAERQLSIALQKYANANQDRVPANFSQIEPYLDDADRSITNQFDLVIQGSLKGITNDPSKTIAVIGKRTLIVDGKPAKVYGFVDGHAEVKSEPPEGFAAWEKRHMVSAQISR